MSAVQDHAGGRASTATASLAGARLPLVLRLALRELRSGLSGFSVFVACIALGVAVITGVGALADSLLSGFQREGRVLLGGDITFDRVHARATAEERAVIQRLGVVSETASVRTMARTSDGRDQMLAEIKAIDAAYPLLGTFRVEGGASLEASVRSQRAILVAPSLAERLKVRVGDTISVGGTPLEIAGLIEDEPDKIVARIAFGPRVVMSLETLEDIGLVGPGTLVRWRYAVTTPQDQDIAALRTSASEVLGKAGYSIEDRRNPSPQLTNTLKRLQQFLSLLGLTALLVGGVGVANAVSTYVEKRRGVIAAYKSLGASQGQVFAVMLSQVLAIAMVGVVVGLSIGLLAPLVVASLLEGALPFALEPSIGLWTVAVGTIYGLLVALLFVLWPLGQAEQIRPAALFRDEVAARFQVPSVRVLVLVAVTAAALVGFAVTTSGMPRVALGFVGGAAVALAVFLALGWLAEHVARRMPRPRRPEIALAMTGIGAPGGLTRSVMVSLGTGLTLLVMVALVDRSLTNELAGRLPANSPDYFAIDIPKGDLATFETAIRRHVPDAVIRSEPMLRGRIVALNGVPAEAFESEDGQTRGLLNGDRGLSFSATPPEGSTIVSGSWWPEDYSGPPLVSFAGNFARRFGLDVGDTVTVNVLGRTITATVANLRDVQWESLAINFSMVFPPSVLSAAPYNLLSTVRFPNGAETAGGADAARAVGRELPAVTLVSVRDAIDAFSGVFERIMTAVRVAGSLTLLAGALVLAGALATAQRRRIAQAVILKCVGATRRRLLAAHLVEYGLIALIAAVVSVAIGTLGAWLIATLVLEIGFAMSWSAVASAIFGALALVLALGSVGTWRVLSARPVPYLRGI